MNQLISLSQNQDLDFARLIETITYQHALSLSEFDAKLKRWLKNLTEILPHVSYVFERTLHQYVFVFFDQKNIQTSRILHTTNNSVFHADVSDFLVTLSCLSKSSTPPKGVTNSILEKVRELMESGQLIKNGIIDYKTIMESNEYLLSIRRDMVTVNPVHSDKMMLSETVIDDVVGVVETVVPVEGRIEPVERPVDAIECNQSMTSISDAVLALIDRQKVQYQRISVSN